MMNLLKKLALSFVVAVSVAATGFAKGPKVEFTDVDKGPEIPNNLSTLEKSLDLGNDNDITKIFDAPFEPQKSFDFGKIVDYASTIRLSDEPFVLDPKPEDKKIASDFKPFDSGFLQELKEDADATNKRVRAQRDQERREAKFREEQEWFNQQTKLILEKQTAPSSPTTLGGYAYSAGKTLLNVADYTVRTRFAACGIGYLGVEVIEEGLAWVGYGVVGLPIGWAAGLPAGQAAGNAAYYGIKTTFKVAHTAFPFFGGALAYMASDTIQGTVNYSLDVVVPTAASSVKKVASSIGSAASYISSYFWS